MDTSGFFAGSHRVPPRRAKIVYLSLKFHAHWWLVGHSWAYRGQDSSRPVLLPNLTYLPVETELLVVVLSVYLQLLRLLNFWPHHLKLPHDIHCLADVELEGLEALIDEDFTLLGNLVLGDAVQVCERLVQERGDVLDLL